MSNPKQFLEIEDTYGHKYIMHLNSSTVFMKDRKGLINIRYNNGSPTDHTVNDYDKFRTSLINLSLLIQTE